MNKNKFYITTPIYYVNDKPHIGHSYTTIVADVLARYNRMLGRDVFFLTGTDEHGAKVAQAAEKVVKEPKEFCDEMAAKFQMTWDSLDISYNKFIRTTDKEHERAVEKFFLVLKEKGAIYEGKYEGLYCTGCEKFITEKELVDGKCPDHKKEPEKILEKNYFFKLKDYLEKVKDLIKPDKIKVEPEQIKKEVLGLFKQNLEDFSVSRESVKWGIKLPFDETQVSYVWVEALQNYISAIGYENDQDKFNKFWPADLHLMAKDIIKFHAIYWPAMLLAADLPLPKVIFAHGFFTINGQKMSKTIGNVIDPNDLVKKYGADATRYLILSQFPFGQDGDIKADKFDEQYNADLANNLGNLFSRVFKLAQSIENSNTKIDEKIKERTLNVWQEYEEAMNDFRIDKSLEGVRSLIDFSNKYIDEKKPWKLKKTDQDEFSSLMISFLEMIRHVAFMIQPFMPNVSDKIVEQIGCSDDKKLSIDKIKEWRKFDIEKIKEGIILFPRI
jgi:methionyl-tRNA synthetase